MSVKDKKVSKISPVVPKKNTDDEIKKDQVTIANVIEPIANVIQPYHDAINANSGAVATITSFSDILQSAMPENPVKSMSAMISKSAVELKPWDNSNFQEMLESATKTQELLNLQVQLKNSLQTSTANLSAVLDYVSTFTSQWNYVKSMADTVSRSIAAQNLAVVKMIPEYKKMNLPYGSKIVLKSLPKSAAGKLTQTKDICFDTKERKFYHKDSPNQKITANQITVVASSQDLFAGISLDDLISFESCLYEDVTFAMEHPVGRRIFDIIKKWNNFINFDRDIYYHARKIEDDKHPYLDQDMLKAPTNVSAHGRYNQVGKSCYYISESKEGAESEIRKHSGGTNPRIQVIGLKPIKKVKMIDLSEEIRGTNNFIDHLRFTVENDKGRIIKEYLLPNFVASCCKKSDVGIEGIRYRSTGYNCCVLWKDDYFEFVEGTREIV